MTGPYPDWDMADLEAKYRVHKLWRADDKDALNRAEHTFGEIAEPSKCAHFDLPQMIVRPPSTIR